MSHPGWTRGVKVRLDSGVEVELLDDGVYLPVSGDGFDGMLWQYRVKFPNGMTQRICPQEGDTIIRGS